MTVIETEALWSRYDIAVATRLIERRAPWSLRSSFDVVVRDCGDPRCAAPSALATPGDSGRFEIWIPPRLVGTTDLDSDWVEGSLVHEMWHFVQSERGARPWRSGEYSHNRLSPLIAGYEAAYDRDPDGLDAARLWVEWYRYDRLYWRMYPQERDARRLEYRLVYTDAARRLEELLFMSPDEVFYGHWPEELPLLSNYGWWIGEDRSLFPRLLDQGVELVEPTIERTLAGA